MIPTICCKSQRIGSRLKLHPPMSTRHCSSQKLHCGRMRRRRLHQCGRQRRTPQRHRQQPDQVRSAGQSINRLHKRHHQSGGKGVCTRCVVSQQTRSSSRILSPSSVHPQSGSRQKTSPRAMAPQASSSPRPKQLKCRCGDQFFDVAERWSVRRMLQLLLRQEEGRKEGE